MSLEDSRQALYDAFDEALPGVSVYAYPPEVPACPAVAIGLDDPFFVPQTIGQGTRGEVRFRVLLFVNKSDNESNLEAFEELAANVYDVIPRGYRAGTLSSLTPIQAGTPDLLAAEIRIATTTTLKGA